MKMKPNSGIGAAQRSITALAITLAGPGHSRLRMYGDCPSDGELFALGPGQI
jgi:hypothetical protein